MNWKICRDFFFALAFLKPYLCSTKRWTSRTSSVESNLLNRDDRRNNLKGLLRKLRGTRGTSART